MNVRSWTALAAWSAMLCAVPSQAQDGLEASVVFFELYERGASATKTPEYVRGIERDIVQFGRYALLDREDAARRLVSTMTTPAQRVNDERLRAIEKMVTEGDKLLYTDPKKAIEILARARAELKQIVENISLDAKIRRDYFKTQMLLVRSHLDNGNEPRAREIMGDVVRTFEAEYPVTTQQYHPRVVKLYQAVRGKLKSQQTGSLTVSSNPPGCEVFLNGRLMEQKTPFTFGNLYPGEIRVNLRKGELQSMLRRVDVPNEGVGKVDVDLQYEASLAFSDQAFGFVMETDDGWKKRLLNYAVKLGRLLRVDYVVVSGVRARGDKQVLSSYQFDVRKRALVRERDLVVKPGVVSQRRIKEASRFLADADSLGETPKAIKPWYENWIGWTVVGAGLGVGAASAAFFAKFQAHKDKVGDPQFSYDEWVAEANAGNSAQNTAGILAGTSGALLVAGALVFVFVELEEDEEDQSAHGVRRPRFWAAPFADGHQVGVGVGGSF